MSDWQDPFVEDEAARERERRRAEREERRRARQAAVAARVGETRQEPPEPSASSPVEPAVEAPAARGRPAPRGAAGSLFRRRRLVVGGVALALGIAAAAVIAVAVGDGDGETAPAPASVHRNEPFTIAEGHDRGEVADLLADTSIKGDYMKATKSFKGFDPARYDAQNPSSLEGFLFPDTYQLPRHPTVDDLVARQLQAFEANFKTVDLSYARSKNLTAYDVLIIASMVEEEVAVPRERKLVAAVIYNRLRNDMPLGIDATIRYITGNHDQPLTQSELAIDSPYNTRTNAGLPPGPIDSPGLASIEAAAHPARVRYLYYVVKPCTDPPQHVFTDSEAEFQQAVARYNAAREAAGGKAPTDC